MSTYEQYITSYLEYELEKERQVGHTELNLHFTVQGLQNSDQTPIPGKYLTIDLSNTVVAPTNKEDRNEPVIAMDTSHHRGWFTDQVVVSVDLSNYDGDSLPSLWKALPDTTNRGVTVTTNDSNTVQASGGAFGEVPMANIGVGFSHGGSVSHTYAGFKVIKYSDRGGVCHYYKLEERVDGEYSGPSSLEVHRKNKKKHYDQGDTGTKYVDEVPNEAKADLKILSKSIWSLDAEKDFQVTATIRIEHHLAYVYIKKKGAHHVFRTQQKTCAIEAVYLINTALGERFVSLAHSPTQIFL